MRAIYLGYHYGEPMPYEYWRVILAEKFGQTPWQIDEWPTSEFYDTIHTLNAIANAERGGRKAEG